MIKGFFNHIPKISDLTRETINHHNICGEVQLDEPKDCVLDFSEEDKISLKEYEAREKLQKKKRLVIHTNIVRKHK